jgi:hypothetical protein
VTGGSAADGKSPDHPEALLPSKDRSCCSVRGFAVGFGVMLGGEPEDPRRGDDFRFGWLQYRIPAGCLPARERLAEVAPNRIFAGHHQLRALVAPGAGYVMLHSWVADPRRNLGGFSVGGRMQMLALDVACVSWFSGAQGSSLWPG